MFTAQCDIRWSDVDAQGHVNNAAVVDYLQEARTIFISSGPARELLGEGIVVVSHQVEYLKPIHYSSQPISIELSVASLGSSRIELAYVISHEGHVVANARTVLCPFDFRQQRPIRLAAEHRAFFAQHSCDIPGLRELSPCPSLQGRGTPVSFTIRWSDIDQYRHANNVKAFDYLQQARVSAMPQWHSSFARAGTADTGNRWLIARQDVRYLAQLKYRQEPYAVLVAPCSIGTTSIVLASEIVDPSTTDIYVRAETVLVSADASGAKKELSSQARDSLARQLIR